MRSSKLTAFLLGMVLCTGLAMAQDPGQSQNDNVSAAQSAPPPARRRPPNPAREARWLGRQLGLSAGQVRQIEPVLADRQHQLENVKTNPTLTPQQRRAQTRDIMRDSNGKIEAVMTGNQKQQYEQMLEARREARRQRMQQQTPPDQQAPQDQPSQQQAPQG